MEKQMKVVCISDTHGRHDSVRVPPCDILIHAGDCTDDAGQASLRRFCVWLERQPAKHKIFIAGNHDWAFEKWPSPSVAMVKEYAPSATYLQDSEITVGGLRIWGSPVSPEFFNWAFNRKRGEEIKRHWDMIPDGIDVLVTHGPAYSILDNNNRGERCGCNDLLDAVLRVKPMMHVFGHIHHANGHYMGHNGTMHVNASICDEHYNPSNLPFEYELGASA